MFELDFISFMAISLVLFGLFVCVFIIFYEKLKFSIKDNFSVSDLDYTNELLKEVRRYVRK